MVFRFQSREPSKTLFVNSVVWTRQSVHMLKCCDAAPVEHDEIAASLNNRTFDLNLHLLSSLTRASLCTYHLLHSGPIHPSHEEMKTLIHSLLALFVGHVAKVLADSCADPSQAVPVYRDFNEAVSDHFYTTNVTEYNAANTAGYFAEDQRFLVFPTAVSSTTQLFRRFNGAVFDHFYSTNATEGLTGGWNLENLSPMFIYSTQICGSVPLYRSFNPQLVDHFYTTSKTEQSLMTGYNFELIAGYVLPLASASSASIGDPSATQSGSKPTTTNAAVGSSFGPRTYIYLIYPVILFAAVL
ncbi:hypothetical protein MSAN_02423400 [Mycena sanguinolenta]|uniref:DUF5648 domain-containing protein n=1 Tax=Mycena sanguinolenta TaxID=230812 RepID=A0A8H6X2M9_9AGAR|nr:hypothetical protein MSAN_02423400 [Mycena sanguinolenta]